MTGIEYLPKFGCFFTHIMTTQPMTDDREERNIKYFEREDNLLEDRSVDVEV